MLIWYWNEGKMNSVQHKRNSNYLELSTKVISRVHASFPHLFTHLYMLGNIDSETWKKKWVTTLIIWENLRNISQCVSCNSFFAIYITTCIDCIALPKKSKFRKRKNRESATKIANGFFFSLTRSSSYLRIWKYQIHNKCTKWLVEGWQFVAAL